MTKDLVNVLADLEEEDAVQIAQTRLGNNEDPMAILGDARKGMR